MVGRSGVAERILSGLGVDRERGLVCLSDSAVRPRLSSAVDSSLSSIYTLISQVLYNPMKSTYDALHLRPSSQRHVPPGPSRSLGLQLEQRTTVPGTP